MSFIELVPGYSVLMNHYIAYKLIVDKWFCFDDRTVSEVKIDGKYCISMAFYRCAEETLVYDPTGKPYCQYIYSCKTSYIQHNHTGHIFTFSKCNLEFSIVYIIF